jgi:hypothetical protein
MSGSYDIGPTYLLGRWMPTTLEELMESVAGGVLRALEARNTDAGSHCAIAAGNWAMQFYDRAGDQTQPRRLSSVTVPPSRASTPLRKGPTCRRRT